MTCDYKIDLCCISVWNLKSIFRGLNRDGVQNLGTESNIVLFKFSYLLFDIFLGTPNGIVEHSVVVLSKKLFVFFFFFFFIYCFTSSEQFVSYIVARRKTC